MNLFSFPIAATWFNQDKAFKTTIQDWHCWTKNSNYFLLLCLAGRACPHGFHYHYQEYWTVWSCSYQLLAMWAYWCWSWESMWCTDSFLSRIFKSSIVLICFCHTGNFPSSESHICYKLQPTKAKVQNLVSMCCNVTWRTKYI